MSIVTSSIRYRVALVLCASLVAPLAFAQSIASYDQLLQRGVKARSSKDFDQATELLQEAVRLVPSDPRAALELGVTHEWAGRLAVAQTVYRDFLRMQPNNAGAILGLARVLRWQWQFDESTEHYLRVLANSEASPAMKLQAQLGLVNIDRMEMRLRDARVRLAPVLAQYPKDEDVLREDAELAQAVRHRISFSLGERQGPSGAAAILQMEWATKINAATGLKVGASNNTQNRPLIATDQTVLQEQSLIYTEITSAIPMGRALRARAEYRRYPSQPNDYILQGEWSDSFAPRWRVNAGLTLARPDAATSNTLSGGLSHAFTSQLDGGVTLFHSLTSAGFQQSTWLGRIGWEHDGIVAQGFVSRATDQSEYKYTGLLRWPIAPRYQVRLQVGRDGVTGINTVSVGLDVTLGGRIGMTLQRDIVGEDRTWLLGSSLALPGAGVASRP